MLSAKHPRIFVKTFKRFLQMLMVISLMPAAGRAQSLTNTATAITLTGTCLNGATLPDGSSYTLVISYTSIATGSPVNGVFPATVAHSGTTMTITAPLASFPSLTSTGYWALSDVDAGSMSLTNGTNSASLYWHYGKFDCSPTLAVANFTGSLNNGQVTLTYQLLGDIQQLLFYRSTDGGQTFYEIRDKVVYDAYPTSFTDGAPGSTNQYRIACYTGSQLVFVSNTVIVNCSTCSFTPPGDGGDCSWVITGPDAICNYQDHEYLDMSGITPYLNAVVWSASPSNLVHLYPDPWNYDAGVSVMRGNGGTGIVTITGVQQTCNTLKTKSILIGLPTNLHIVTDLSNPVNCSATCDQIPGVADASYTWTLNLGAKGTTTYTGRLIHFSLPSCSVGYVNVSAPTACGTAHDRAPVSNQSGCPGKFALSPNPATATVTISPAITGAAKSALAQTDMTISRIDCYNRAGTLVLTRSFTTGTGTISLDISTLKPDIYTVLITYGNGKSTEAQQLSVMQ